MTARALPSILALLLTLHLSPAAPAKTLFAAFDKAGAISRTAELDADNAAVPQDGSCAGCLVIAPDDPRLIAFTAAQHLRSSKISRREFLHRFTPAQLTAISAAARANDAINVWLITAQAADQIDLADPLTKQGLDALTAAGIITAADATAILTP